MKRPIPHKDYRYVPAKLESVGVLGDSKLIGNEERLMYKIEYNRKVYLQRLYHKKDRDHEDIAS
jgi:hypothetical protein